LTSGQDALQTLQLEVNEATKVAVVTMNRPPVNAVNAQMRIELRDTFRAFAGRRDVNCVVLTGAGDRAFCAGVDLRDRAASEEVVLDSGKLWRDARVAVLDCAIPVIGAINGVAIGAGFGLASMCDFLLAAEGARMGLTEINVGLLGGGSAGMHLTNRYKMRRMYFTGELQTAEEMHRLGAVEAVLPREELMPEALRLAEEIAQKSPIGLRLAKESLNRMEAFLLPYEDAYRMEQDYTNRLSTFEDSREGTRAFLEKREPDWKWR
jgi:enoyl-CoA hydratase